MYTEYDVIESKKNLGELINAATVGTILCIYNSNPKQYEVEFVDKNMNTIEIITVSENDIKLSQLPL